jgi:hypothetical protein
LSHIAGGAISGYLVPQRTFYLGTDYGRIFKAGSLVLAAAAITNMLQPDSIFIYLLAAMSSGIQNGMTSRSSPHPRLFRVSYLTIGTAATSYEPLTSLRV